MTTRSLLSTLVAFTALMSGLVLGVSSASAQEGGGPLVSAAEPAGIIKLLRDRGQTAILTVDEFNDPFIETSFGNRDYSVWFYGCTAHEDCQSISLRATRMSPGRASLEALNGWNVDQRWTKVYSAEVNAAVLEMDISFRAGPMTSDGLLSILDIWDASMEQFVRFIDDGEYDFVD